MREVRAGSPDAFGELMRRYWPALVRFAVREVDSIELARDLAQDVFLHVWERRSHWRARGSVRAYLFRILRSRIIDEQRKRKVRRRWLTTAPFWRASAPDPVSMTEASELQAAFHEALTQLPRRRREVFQLVHLQGLSYSEAAEVLGIAPQTVANQLAAALRHLRTSLATLVLPSDTE